MSFFKVYKKEANISIKANGRINLLGEHTDYNHGLVLPKQIDAYTRIDVGINTAEAKNTIFLYSEYNEEENQNSQKNTPYTRQIMDSKQQHWTDYIIGALQTIYTRIRKYDASFDFPSLNFYISSDIPPGAGLSSSAALEVGILKSIRELCTRGLISVPSQIKKNQDWNDIEIAKMAQDAENNYIGLPCGLMDQLVISIGNTHSATFIDFGDNNNPQYQLVELPDSLCTMIISSGYTHKLTTSGDSEEDKGYQTRFEQCQEAARILNIAHLSVLTPKHLEHIISQKLLPQILQNRVQHIVEENQRVRIAMTALTNKDLHTFARCLSESHVSQKNLYNVSIPEIDSLVESAMNAGAMGARLTGGGFGGSIIVQTQATLKDEIWQKISSFHPLAKLLQ